MRRAIATTTQQASRQIRDLLQSVLVLEVLRPTGRVWLVSAWIIDAPVIDNRGGEFNGLVPSWPEREIMLSEVVVELVAGGSAVTVVTNNHPANRAFPEALRRAATLVDTAGQLRLEFKDNLATQQERGLHRKRLVTDRFVLWGSMNFTYSGFERNAEDVVLDTTTSAVATAVNEMEQLYAPVTGVHYAG